MLPLIGRIADLRGLVPVLVAALVVFAAGSLLTALAYDMPTMVTAGSSRASAGGLVPRPSRSSPTSTPSIDARPLGVVSAVQEIGSVLGPLFGAVVLSVADWRFIFVVNLVVGLVLAVAIRRLAGDRSPRRAASTGRGPAAAVTLVAGALVFVRPPPLLRDLTCGAAFVPFAGDGRWLTPVGAVAIVAGALFLARTLTASRPLVDLRGWGAIAVRRTSPAPCCSPRPSRASSWRSRPPTRGSRCSPTAASGTSSAAVAAVAFAVHLRRAEAPIIRRRPQPHPRVGVAGRQLLRRRP